MEDLDNESATDILADERLFLREVVCGDAELFYLDVCLREALSPEADETGVNV